MGDFIKGLATAPHHSSMRGFQVLSHRDLARLETFFLAFDFDQRRKYFGDGMSEAAIRQFCRTIPWNETTAIACAAASNLDAIAVLTAPADQRTAELSIACAASCDAPATTADLLDLALTVASLSYSELIVHRACATSELLALLDCCASTASGEDVVRIAVPSCSARIIAC
jgi:hypothetical protein